MSPEIMRQLRGDFGTPPRDLVKAVEDAIKFYKDPDVEHYCCQSVGLPNGTIEYHIALMHPWRKK